MQQVAQIHPARQGLRLEPRRGFYFLSRDAEYEALKKSIERWDLVAQEDRYYECRKS